MTSAPGHVAGGRAPGDDGTTGTTVRVGEMGAARG